MTHKKLKGALIGYGFISSKGHMPAYLERSKKDDDVEIIAICDICPDRKKDVPEGILFFENYRELLREVGSRLDFVDIATHAADHYRIAKTSIEFGLNVLCEKPLTTTTEEALDLIQTAIAHKKVLFPCHNYKHAPVVRSIREVIESGKIGKVHSITLNTFRNSHAVGTKEWLPDWRRYKEFSGGGIAMDHGSHSLYLTFEWLRGYPKAVTATAKNFAANKFDTEDYFSAVYEFEEGIANVHLAWNAGTRKVLYALQGTNGAITVDDDKMEIAVVSKKESESISHKAEWEIETRSIASDWMDSSHTSWFNSMFDNFKKAIAENDYFNDEIRDAYFCIMTIMKSYESIQNDSVKIKLSNSFPNIL
jgi:predicted dehydrogenase